MPLYVYPKNSILKKIKRRSKIKIIWEPMLTIKYENSENKLYEILTDSLIPRILGDPISSVLLSRKKELFEFTLDKPLEGVELEHTTRGEEVINNFILVFEDLEKLKSEVYQNMKEEMNLNIDWSRYRSLLIYSERLLKRDKSIFPYLRGQEPISKKFVETVFLENILKIGLGIKTSQRPKIIEEKKVFYPLAVDEHNTVYEIAWKKDKSIAYTSFFAEEVIKKIVEEKI
ncbi:MAG: hypothetical protein ACP6IP_10760 [Candidatus Njordarchaeia archaeon]